MSDAAQRVDADGNIVSIHFALDTIERFKKIGDGSKIEAIMAQPVVMTGDPDMMDRLRDVKKGDLVVVHGLITTTEMPMVSQCRECGNIDYVTTDFTYISPYYAEILDRGLSERDAFKKLRDIRGEVSNRVALVGRVADDPEYDDNNGEDIPKLTYILEVPRSQRIHEEGEEALCDYPLVEVRGEHALADRDALQKGSRVYIVGHVATKQMAMEYECPSCHFRYRKNLPPYAFIKPSRTEYLEDCIIPADEDAVDFQNRSWNKNEEE
jgi:primosomal replication protein N